MDSIPEELVLVFDRDYSATTMDGKMIVFRHYFTEEEIENNYNKIQGIDCTFNAGGKANDWFSYFAIF